jgi:hypothetical protein
MVMKMKRIIPIFMILLLAAAVMAQGAGTTPDSILYGLDRAMESIKLAFTRNNEKRADLHLQNAEERLAEIQQMVQEKKTKYVDMLEEDREASIAEAQQEITKAAAKGQDTEALSAQVAEMTSKHLEILQSLLDKVPEESKVGIQNAIDKSARAQAPGAVVGEQPAPKNDAAKNQGKPETPAKGGQEKDTQTATQAVAQSPAQTQTGTLKMQITDKKPELDITKLQVTISQIQVHTAGNGGTSEEVCNEENITEELCDNETITVTIPDCINITSNEEACENITINETTIENCTNTTVVEENCTDMEVNQTQEVCENVTTIVEDCNDETTAGENWFTVAQGPKTFNLIELQGVKDLLGEKDLTAGKYTQIRLTVDSAELEIGGIKADIKIPSGKLKLVKNFNIEANKTTTLTLDFDAQTSVHQAGSKYNMKPTIKVIQE